MRQIFLVLSIQLVLTMVCNSQNFEWVIGAGGASLDRGTSTTIDQFGNIYVSGYFADTVDFDPGSSSYNLISNGGYDIFILKLNASGHFIWAKNIGGLGTDQALSIDLDSGGGVFVSGRFSDTVDFDPGIGISNHISNGQLDIFVLKLNTNGNFLWAKSVGGTNNDSPNALNINVNGDIYCAGNFQGIVDFDPGPNNFSLTSITFTDMFILKLDNSGNFIKALQIGGDVNETLASLTLDIQGNLFITGSFSDTIDFDPNPSIAQIVAQSASDIFLLKLDFNESFLWVKSFSSSNISAGLGRSVCVDKNGDVVFVGDFSGIVDFDPGLDTSNLTATGAADIFVAKLDSNGIFKWAKSLNGGSSTIGDVSTSVKLDSLGNIYFVGSFNDSLDFDPGLGIHMVYSNGVGDGFISKLDFNGNFIWAYPLGSNGSDGCISLILDDYNNVYTIGTFTDTVDFDLSSSNTFLSANGNLDLFLLKLNQDICSNLAIVVDSINDVECFSGGFCSIHVLNGSYPINYMWNTTPISIDSLTTFNQEGLYSLTITDNNGCQRTTTYLINGPEQSGFDLTANLSANNFRHGLNNTVMIDAFNKNCDTISGQVLLIYNSSDLTVSSTYLSTPFYQNDTLIWNFSNINYDSLHLISYVVFQTNSNLSLGNVICMELIITPFIGDQDSINNRKQYCFPVVNSYDPNDKQVYPQGICEQGYILNTQEPLTYTVRFQNTGNAPAIDIYILDTLDSDLDLNSVRVIGKSHEHLIIEVLPGNVLKFSFPSIYLPDSNSNEAESHGYVIYEVKHLNSLPNGTTIENRAGIYFDFNPPIITNTVLNTLVSSLPTCSVGTTESLHTKSFNCNLYPNPTSGRFILELINSVDYTNITIYNSLGQQIYYSQINKNLIEVNLDGESGMYFICIENSNGDRLIKKIIKY